MALARNLYRPAAVAAQAAEGAASGDGEMRRENTDENKHVCETTRKSTSPALSGGLQPTLQLGSSGPPLSVATCFAGILGRLPLSVRWRRKTGQGGPWEAAPAAPRETGRGSSRHSEMRGLVPTLVVGWATGPFPSLPRVFPVAWLSELEISPPERQRHTGPGPCTEGPRIEVNSLWMTHPRVSWSLL